MKWPDAPNDYPLGDSRFALAAERHSEADGMAESVRRHVDDGAAIYPQGGRTALEIGGQPSRPGIVMDLTGMDQVIDYPAADMTITVEAGITLASLQSILESEGQRLPLEAPFPERATIGGIYSTDTCGPRRYGLGRPRDLIIGVAFITSQGSVVRGGGRVVKNVAGYDLPKLLTGSYGSLGIIVNLTMKTRPRPESTAILWAQLKDFHETAARLGDLNTSQARPVAIEMLNAPASAAVSQASGLDLPTSGPVLAVGVEGSREAVSWQLNVLRGELGCAMDQVVVGEHEAERLWTALTSHVATESLMSFKAMVPPSSVSGFVEGVDPGKWAVQSHAGSGIIWGLARPEVPLDEMAPDVLTLRERAIGVEGSLILQRCPTHLKSDLGIWGPSRGDWELSRMIKQALDPAGAMNPGRFLC